MKFNNGEFKIDENYLNSWRIHDYELYEAEFGFLPKKKKKKEQQRTNLSTVNDQIRERLQHFYAAAMATREMKPPFFDASHLRKCVDCPLEE